MTNFAPTARPVRAAIAWATKDAIFCEIPCAGGPPLIVRYHKTEAGLAAALNVIVSNPEVESRTIQRDHPKIKFAPKATFTEDQRQGVREVLKALKIV